MLCTNLCFIPPGSLHEEILPVIVQLVLNLSSRTDVDGFEYILLELLVVVILEDLFGNGIRRWSWC